jgi:5-methylcytosine-specific restriction endonuclease McrA
VCGAQHFLSIRDGNGGFVVQYQRYTQRYAPDEYDDGTTFPVITLGVVRASKARVSDHAGPFSGPIVVYPRRKRFSADDLHEIWTASHGRCHLCNRRWKLAHRGRDGWHVDHVIPHAGGGIDTESLRNLRLACARCNIRKGRGYTKASVAVGLCNLIRAINYSRSRAALERAALRSR